MVERDDFPLDTMIDRGIRSYARQEHPGRGEHPTEQELVDYQEGRLGGPEEAALRRHLTLCPDCADDLLMLADWDASLPTEPARFPTPLSPAARRRPFEARVIAAHDRRPKGEGHAGARTAQPPVPPPSRQISALLAAGLATASLALGLLLGSSWLGGLGSDEGPSAAAVATERPFFFDLLPDGATLRRSDPDQEIRRPPGMNSLIARLNLGDQTPYDEYRVEILGPSSDVVWSRQGLTRQPAGSFALLIDGEELRPGSYRLLLVGRTGATEAVLATYSFSLSSLPAE